MSRQHVVELLPIQKKLYNSKKEIAGLFSSRAVGKTYILSWLITMSIIQGEKSLAFSQTYKSLTQNLFNEVMKRFGELNIVPNYNKAAMSIAYNGGLCYGYSYENHESCRGLTECHNLFLDELALAPNDILAVTAPCLRGKGIIPHIRFASTPRAGSYWNKLIKDHIQTGDWDIFTGTMKENKFLTEESIRMAEEAISDPLMKRQELYGEILDDVVENCIVDITDFVAESQGRNDVYYCGIDFARTGDNTVLTVRNDYELIEQVVMKGDTDAICSEFRRLDNIYHFKDVFEDSTGGFNIGFHDTMKHTHKNLHEINFGGKSTNPADANARTNIYFNMADAIRNGFFIPFRYNSTVEQIKATSYIINNSGKRALVPKDIIKNIIGHSPDEADSLALTFYALNTVYVVEPERCQQLTSILFR